jgi:hypothetical protein
MEILFYGVLCFFASAIVVAAINGLSLLCNAEPRRAQKRCIDNAQAKLKLFNEECQRDAAKHRQSMEARRLNEARERAKNEHYAASLLH